MTLLQSYSNLENTEKVEQRFIDEQNETGEMFFWTRFHPYKSTKSKQTPRGIPELNGCKERECEDRDDG
jgi:hypothetical protein